MPHQSKGYTKRRWPERYKSSLKQLKPFRSASKQPENVMPGPDRGFLSLYSLSWLTSLMRKACQKKLGPEDIWTLRSEDSCHTSYVRLERQWHRELEQKGPQNASLTRTLIRTFRTRMVMTTLMMLVSNSLALFGQSILLRQVILYLNDGTAPLSQALLLLVGMVVVRLLTVYFLSASTGITSVFTGSRASGALQLLVYHKLLRLNAASDQILGKVVNICTNDMERVLEGFQNVAFVFSGLFMTAYGFVVNLVYVGPWSLLGFTMIIMSFFLLGSFGGMNSVLRMEVVKVTDKRVTFMSEVLAAIRLIKMYAWEDSFKHNVDQIRAEEMRIVRRATMLRSVSTILEPMIPVLATATSVIGYIASGNELRAAEAFTMFSVFNALQMAVGALPYGIRMLTEAHVVLIRIQRMLLMRDLEVVLAHCDSDNAIEIEDASFAWEKPVDENERKTKTKHASSTAKSPSRNVSSPQMPSVSTGSRLGRLRALTSRRRPAETDRLLDAETATKTEVVLSGVQLIVPRGQLLGVAGSVGSGKTSLLTGITGQLRVLCGGVRRAGAMAVVPQRAWIFSGTVRENILFGRPYLPELYQRTVAACALQPDFALMENGDLSEIGERGVNLSGGQKQRVNLARAVYADADIYLMDDPLSAVDSKVGRHIFQQCVRGVLREKTVVLVSHGVQYLSQCDEVLFMKDCQLSERGTHQELMQLEGGYFQLVSCDAASQQHHQPEQKAPDTVATEETGSPGGRLTTDEKYESTTGILKTFLDYCKQCSLCGMLIVLLLTLLFSVARAASGVYLQYWIDAGDGLKEERLRNMTLYNATYTSGELSGAINDGPNVDMYLLGYAGVVLLPFLVGFIKAGIHCACAIRGALRIHDRMVSSLMRCRMSFFDSTPSGRIINRLSRDMDCVDTRIPENYEYVSQRWLIVFVQLMIPAIAYPYFVVVVIAILVLYMVMWRCLVTGVTSTKQIENVARSPVLHHLTSTVGGLSVIRAYGKERMMVERFEQLLDDHTASLLTFKLANSWFMLRGEELGVILLAVVASTVLLVPGASPAEAGLILSLVYDSIMVMSFLVTLCAYLAAFLSSVMRCTEYSKGLEYEPAAVCDGDSEREGQWPCRGAIRLDGVSLRYRADLPRVLHHISLDIPARQKVGIVGRTGAGKSTLISTMLRLMDLEEGQVLIDDVDISQVGLRQLRSHIAVIPQDPVLFTGTIRQNLDPFDEQDDTLVWHALERAGLKAKVSRLPLQLGTPLTSDADSFSVGERQLVCLARALLRRARVLLLDEATASVDVQTDFLIQRTIHEDFEDSTVVTIAHRLNTVLSYGMIVVMQDGKIAETGSPGDLAAQPGSQFRQMLDQAGISAELEPQTRPPLAEHEPLSDGSDPPSPTRAPFCVSGNSDVTPACCDKARTPTPDCDEEVSVVTAPVRTKDEAGEDVTNV